jgi:hypothetical protein
MRYKVYNPTNMLKTLSAFMTWLVFVNSAYAAKMNALDTGDASRPPASQTQTIKDRAVKIPAGSKVEVRLTNKEKLKGRVGAVSDDGMVLEYSKAGQTEERKIAFGEVQSLKKQRSTAWSVTRKALIVSGVIWAIVTLANVVIRP